MRSHGVLSFSLSHAHTCMCVCVCVLPSTHGLTGQYNQAFVHCVFMRTQSCISKLDYLQLLRQTCMWNVAVSGISLHLKYVRPQHRTHNCYSTKHTTIICMTWQSVPEMKIIYSTCMLISRIQSDLKWTPAVEDSCTSDAFSTAEGQRTKDKHDHSKWATPLSFFLLNFFASATVRWLHSGIWNEARKAHQLSSKGYLMQSFFCKYSSSVRSPGFF